MVIVLKNISKFFFVISLFFLSISNAESLFEDASKRGINETCALYLSQIEDTYNIQGLNITFAHPKNPSIYPSLHISSQKYNNGTSTFSVTLSPDGDYCYLSTMHITSVDDQSCKKITELKVEVDPNLKVETYAEGGYSIITPSDNSYQIILASFGENGCTINETRMMWPGR